MTTTTAALELGRPVPAAEQPVARTRTFTSSLPFDRVYVLLSAWLLGGLFVDGWAHVNLASLETFFTPWHGLFYSGFFAILAAIGVGIGRGRAAGYRGLQAIPAGYELSVLGAGIFMVGGVLDMLWHITFGIEVDVEALLSPTHLMLASGLFLILSGPARAAWRRARGGQVPDGWSAQLPMLLSLTYLLGLLAFFTQYIHPTSSGTITSSWGPLAATVPTSGGHDLELPYLFQAPMLSGVMLQTGLLVGIILVALRRAGLPFGALTPLIGLTTVGMVLMRQKWVGDVREPLLVAGLVGGLLADGLLLWLRPSFGRPRALQAFAALFPMAMYATYFAVLLATDGLWWTIHLWAGAVFLAGVAGWLLALLVSGTTGREAVGVSG